MTHFLNYLKILTTKIQEEKLNPFSFDLIKLSKISETELQEIKEEVKNIELMHVNEFWDLTEIIYKNLMLKTISKDLEGYFQKIQSSESDIVEITYQFLPWKEFELTYSNSDKTRIALQTKHAEQKIQQFLDYLGIDDNSWMDSLYDFDYAFNFESEIESIFRDIAFES